MKFRLDNGLPMVSVSLEWNKQRLTLDNVLLDTGSAGTIFSADKLAGIGLMLAPDDEIRQIYGVGGSEFVFVKRVDKLALGELAVLDFTIELGALDYGFVLDGIIGTDFLRQTGARISFSDFEVV